jgi:hypothetical protein
MVNSSPMLGWLRELLSPDELQLLNAPVQGGDAPLIGTEAVFDRDPSLAALCQYRVLVPRAGRLCPQPDLSLVDWDGLRARAVVRPAPAWQARLSATAALLADLLAVFERCSHLTRPTPQSRREDFLVGQEWHRPLLTMFSAAGSNLAWFETVIRGALENDRAQGFKVYAPQDIRLTALQLAPQVRRAQAAG